MIMKSQFAACARKAAYPTSAEAESAARGRFGVYLCPVCARYHLTSSRPGSANAGGSEAEQKPSFETSLLGRAKLKRPKTKEIVKIEIATCLGRARPDGRVRLELGGQEVLSEPVQPASMRLEMGQGVQVRVRLTGGACSVIGK